MILILRNMKRIIYSVAIAAFLVTSCQKTDVLNVVEDAIEFDTEVGKMTKADIDYDNDAKYSTLVSQGFRVWAVADFVSGAIKDGDIYDGINGISVNRNNSAWGFTGGKHLWPSEGNFLYFYMISSKDEVSMVGEADWLTQIKNANYFSKAEVSTVSLPMYTIATDTKVIVDKAEEDAITLADNDIMVADHIRQDKSGDGKDKTVKPYFRHTMTKVEFNFVKGAQSVGTPANVVILKSITTSKLKNKGELKIEYGKDELFDWTNEGGQVPFTKVANDTVTYVANTGEVIEAVENVDALNAIEGKEGALRVVYTDEGAVVYRCSEEKVWEVDATENVYKTVNGKVLSTTKTNFVTWYMIPQDLTGVTTDAANNGNVTDEGTIVTIEYVADGKDITQKFSLAVDGVTEDWTKETCVRYNVTIAPHKIIFDPSVDKWNTDLDKDGDDDTDNEENDKDHVDMNN